MWVQNIHLQSSKQVMTSGKHCIVNVATILGERSTGGGVFALDSALASMDVPCMPKSMFIATKRLISETTVMAC